MPRINLYSHEATEEVQDIITAVPSWIIRWGITIILITTLGILLGSASIKYPDIIRASMKVNSLNAPKFIVARQTGKISRILVKEGGLVKIGQDLGSMETTGDPTQIERLERILKQYRVDILSNPNYELINIPTDLNLGELQAAYQSFYLAYFQFKATTKQGYYSNKLKFLQYDLINIRSQKSQIKKVKNIRIKEYNNEEEEYKAYQKLYKNKVISKSEFSLQENKFLSSQYPVQQSKSDILYNNGILNDKKKELMEIEHTILKEKSEFLQNLNNLINEVEIWKLKYLFKSPINGRVSFPSIIQPEKNIQANQEVFVVNPVNEDFFGEIQIPQYNMGKIKLGSAVIIKLRSFPYEQYGSLRGKLTYISDVAYRDSVFLAKVEFGKFKTTNPDLKISLKNGMVADVEIIAEESTLLTRFFRNLLKNLN